MSGKSRDFLGAFIVGGAIGVVGQLLVTLYTALGAPPALVPVLMLASISIISTILDIFGIYGKITFFGGVGAMLPFCGLPPSISMAARAQLGEGKSFVSAIWPSLKPAAIIFSIGYVFCIILAVLANGLVR